MEFTNASIDWSHKGGCDPWDHAELELCRNRAKEHLVLRILSTASADSEQLIRSLLEKQTG